MARAHFVKAAAKDHPEHGIKKGESYWWWAFRSAYGSRKVYSKTQPKPSQLIQSDFLRTVAELQERISELTADDSLPSEVEDIVSEIESLRDEQQEKLDNMPESLQSAPTGEMLQERYDGLDSWVSDLQGIDLSEPDDEDDSDKEEAGEEPERDTFSADDYDGSEEKAQAAFDEAHSEWKAAVEEAAEARKQAYWEEKLEEVQGCEASF